MPAIDLARLNLQAARLAEHFSNPPAFVRELHEVLEFYTNRTMRPSQVAQKRGLPTHDTPPQVLRALERELLPLAEQLPHKGVLLVSELWKDGWLESRLLAARLTGMLPPAQAMPILGRLSDWLTTSTDQEIRRALLTDALARVRTENLEAFLLLVEDWLQSSRPLWQIWGFQALIPLLESPDFENLPIVFRILRPALLAASPHTQSDLQHCLLALARLSPIETSLYLQEILNQNPPDMCVRTLRRILPSLPVEIQNALRDRLRPQKTSV
ncbi:MAG: DNA alkylation repair protein [Anaerolineales bacterium]|nr:DNA alkylation repair protein [Anaerolineales bacterium]MCX7608733.1 DNA alkylation repair protein [Anaerolineales bacterium]MDW8226723.1 hypothetical protein [Anaerolineales bacterium]